MSDSHLKGQDGDNDGDVGGEAEDPRHGEESVGTPAEGEHPHQHQHLHNRHI